MRTIHKFIYILCVIAITLYPGNYTAVEVFAESMIYVSAGGNDSNPGTAAAPVKTLAKAYEKIGDSGNILVSGSVAYQDPVTPKSGTVTIMGNTGATLTLPSKISLKSGLSVDGVTLSGASTIYANGKSLRIGENVTSNARLTVYGGAESGTYKGDTDITLLGGLYQRVYGGGATAMTGNTNVLFGGNANMGDGNDDKASNISPCSIYGGSLSGSVTGETNVTLAGNAVTKMIYGAGAAGGATKTNIYIEGGKAMNVFGGTNGATIDGCSTNVTITGGQVEAIFGGSESRPMTNSHTHVNLLGGDVSRRVYSGCYNGTTTKWGIIVQMSTTHAVSGTTTLTFGKNAKVNSKTGLHSENQTDMGVFGGSRLQSKDSNEKSTVIYLDNCYSSKSGTMGSQDMAGLLSGFKSNVTYTIKAGEGGRVTVPDEDGKIQLIPDMGNVAKISSSYYGNEIVSASSATTVTFEKNFGMGAVTSEVTDNKLTVTVDVTANNIFNNENNPQIYAVVTDKESGEMIECQKRNATTKTETFEFEVEGETNEYQVKTMIWDDGLKPLSEAK